MNFTASRRKVERSVEHIYDLNKLLKSFAESDFYAVSVKEYEGSNHVFIDIDKSGFDATRAALIIGDVLHNLKSALDILYYQTFDTMTGAADHRTRFPIRDERQQLITSIDGGLKEKRLATHRGARLIVDLLLDIVYPYKAGNHPIWALHNLNIRDKHQLLIPVFDVMRFLDIRLEDEGQNVFLADNQPYYTRESFQFKIERAGRLTVHDKGHAALEIVFDIGVPYQDQSVIQSLHEIAESVTRTIDAFGLLPLRRFFD